MERLSLKCKLGKLVSAWTNHLEQRSSPGGAFFFPKKLIGAPGLTTRSKDATRGSWPYY